MSKVEQPADKVGYIVTSSCAFLHNYETSANDALFDEKYKKFIDKIHIEFY